MCFWCVLYGVNFMLFLTWPLERFLVYAYLRPFNFERFLVKNLAFRCFCCFGFVIFGSSANLFFASHFSLYYSRVSLYYSRVSLYYSRAVNSTTH